MKKKSIFREVALERLSSPDQLDQAMRVTGPHHWLALLACLGVIACVIVWSIFGQIPYKVEARGILIKSGGVAKVLASSKGQITTLYIEKDEIVEKGQILARVDQTELVDSLNQARKEIEELERQLQQRKKLSARKAVKEEETRERSLQSLERQIKVNQEKIKNLSEEIRQQEKLVREGLITRKKLVETLQEMDDTQDEIDTHATEIMRLEAEKAEELFVDETESVKIENDIREKRREISSTELKLDLLSKVVSPFTGRVVDIQTGIGDLINPGDQLMTLERAGRDVQDLELILFVSPMDGKKVHSNMLVQVAPSTVKREEYGYMLGMVTYVSAYPSSRKSMMQALNNEQLVEMFSESYAPVAIYANLIPAPKTPESPSGYKWSSSKGPPLELSTGTLCSASITIEKKRPISFVMPGFRKMYDQLMNLFT